MLRCRFLWIALVPLFGTPVLGMEFSSRDFSAASLVVDQKGFFVWNAQDAFLSGWGGFSSLPTSLSDGPNSWSSTQSAIGYKFESTPFSIVGLVRAEGALAAAIRGYSPSVSGRLEIWTASSTYFVGATKFLTPGSPYKWQISPTAGAWSVGFGTKFALTEDWVATLSLDQMIERPTTGIAFLDKDKIGDTRLTASLSFAFGGGSGAGRTQYVSTIRPWMPAPPPDEPKPPKVLNE